MTPRWGAGIAGVAVGAIVVLCTALSLLAEASWVFDLLANFRFQYLWIGGLALAAIVWNRWWVPALVVAVAVGVNLAPIAPYWLGSIPEAVGDGRLEILHLNTRSANPRKADVVEFVRQSDADLVFLAEVTPDLLELLQAADLPFTQVAGTPAVTPIGILALSRSPEVTGRLTNLGTSEVPAVLVTASVGNQPIDILAFHTSSPGEERRSADRNDQLESAAAIVRDRDLPMVLVGDFNATPWTPAFRRLLDAGLSDAQRGRGVAGSWPAGWGPFMIPIDHLLHTAELTTTAYAFGSDVGSDHRSLRVSVARAG